LEGRAAKVDANGDNAFSALFDFKSQLQPLAGNELDAAEVYVGPHSVCFALIERAILSTVNRR
jgi:hypothetical protein